MGRSAQSVLRRMAGGCYYTVARCQFPSQGKRERERERESEREREREKVKERERKRERVI